MKTRLRVLRAEKEWSQAELAETVGVTRQCINAIETGKYEPGLDLAFKIARVFGKNIEEVFLYAEGEQSSPSSCGRFEVTQIDVQQFALPSFPFCSTVEFCSCRTERGGVLPCPEVLTDSKSTTFAILVLTPGAM